MTRPIRSSTTHPDSQLRQLLLGTFDRSVGTAFPEDFNGSFEVSTGTTSGSLRLALSASAATSSGQDGGGFDRDDGVPVRLINARATQLRRASLSIEKTGSHQRLGSDSKRYPGSWPSSGLRAQYEWIESVHVISGRGSTGSPKIRFY
jgi:hypothetical protein